MEKENINQPIMADLFTQRVVIDFSDEAKAFLKSLFAHEAEPAAPQCAETLKPRQTRNRVPKLIEISAIAKAYGVGNAAVHMCCDTLQTDVIREDSHYYVKPEQATQIASMLTKFGASRRWRKSKYTAY